MTIFNKEEILEKLGDDEEFLKELAEIFIESYPEQMSNIEEAINNNDNNLLFEAAHTLKGAISNFGKNTAYEMAFKLETIGKEGKMDEAEKNHRVLVKEIEQLVNALKDV